MATTSTPLPAAQTNSTQRSRADTAAASAAEPSTNKATSYSSPDPLAVLESKLVEYHKHHPFHHLHLLHLHGQQQQQQDERPIQEQEKQQQQQQQQQQPAQDGTEAEPERGRRLSVDPVPAAAQSPKDPSTHASAQPQHHDGIYGPTLTVGGPGAAAASSRGVSPSVSPSPSTDGVLRSPSPGARRCMAATAAWTPRMDRRQSWDGQAYRRAMMVQTGLAGEAEAQAAAQTAEAEAEAAARNAQAAAREQQAWAAAAARAATAGGGGGH